MRDELISWYDPAHDMTDDQLDALVLVLENGLS